MSLFKILLMLSLVGCVPTNTFKEVGEQTYFQSPCITSSKQDLEDQIRKVLAYCPEGTQPQPTQDYYFEACNETEFKVFVSFICILKQKRLKG